MKKIDWAVYFGLMLIGSRLLPHNMGWWQSLGVVFYLYAGFMWGRKTAPTEPVREET